MKKIKTTSLIKNKIKKSNISEKDFEKRKINSLKISIFIGLFGWLICGAYTKEIFRSGVGGILLMIIVFALSLYWPIIKQKQYGK